jgi:hypothetical protein
VERGWGVNIFEDARDCSVLYIRKYFVLREIHKKDIERMASSFLISFLLIGSPISAPSCQRSHGRIVKTK